MKRRVGVHSTLKEARYPLHIRPKGVPSTTACDGHQGRMQWTCEACTLVNEAGRQACEACGTPANGPAANGSRSDDDDDEEESEDNVSFAEEEEDTSGVPAELAEGFKRIQEEQDRQAAREVQETLEREQKQEEKARRKREKELKQEGERRKRSCQLGRVDVEALLAHVRARLPEQGTFDLRAEGPLALHPLIGDWFKGSWSSGYFDHMIEAPPSEQSEDLNLARWITRGLTPSAGATRYAKYLKALAARKGDRIRLPELYVVQLSTAFVHLSYRAAPLSIGSEERSRLVMLAASRKHELVDEGLLNLPEAAEWLRTVMLIGSRHGLPVCGAGGFPFVRLLLEAFVALPPVLWYD